MEKEKFIPYFKLCQHYFNAVDAFLNAEPKSDFLSVTIYQKDLVFAAKCLMDYSHALHDSIISACIDYNIDNVKKAE